MAVKASFSHLAASYYIKNRPDHCEVGLCDPKAGLLQCFLSSLLVQRADVPVFGNAGHTEHVVLCFAHGDGSLRSICLQLN